MRGRRLGRYELGDVLGSGGMGVVYRARDVELDRDVAVKVLDASSLSVGDELIARFEREAKAAAALRHSNIVAVHDVGRVGDVRYFTMDLVRGRTADELGPMSPRRAAEIVRDAARAVHFAHGKGVLHRDIKPGNILVSEDGPALVMDFGLARRLDESTPRLTVTGEIFGTPHYMSPEQASGREVDARADVWGLGATLYSLLAGRAPFDGGEIFDVLGRVVREDPPPIGGRAPAELEAIAMKCMEKDPAARYASAEALASDLENWLDGRPVNARPVGRLTRLGRRARRNPALTAVGALAILACAVAGGFAVARALDADAERDRARAALAEGRPEDAIRHYERARALWTDDDAELAAAIGGVRRELAERQWRQALTAAYLDLYDGTIDLIEEAESRSRTAAELDADFDARAADWRRDHPGDHRFVEALKGWMLFLAGDEEDGLHRIESTCGGDARESIGRMYRGRLHLALAMRSLGEHRLNYGTAAVATELEFPPQMKHHLGLASADFRHVAESGIFGSLRRRREMEAQVEGLRAVAEGRYADALVDLRDMERLPGLRRDGLRAQGIVALAEGRWRDAVEILDRVHAMKGATPQDRYLLGESLFGLGITQPADADALLRRAADVFSGGLSEGPRKEPFFVGRAVSRHALAAIVDSDSEECVRLREDALEDILRAIELSPADPGLRINGGTIRSDLAMWKWLHGRDPAGDFDLAEADFLAARRAVPEMALLYDNLSLLYIRRSQWEAAAGLDPTGSLQRCVEALDSLVARTPQNAEGWFRRGEANLNLANARRFHGVDPTEAMERALADFIESLRLDPTRVYAAFGAANLQVELSLADEAARRDPRARIEKAVELYERAIQIGPPDASTHANLALSLKRLGVLDGIAGADPAPMWTRALDQYDRAVVVDPTYWRAWLGMGELLASMGRVGEAREALEAARRIAPDEPHILRALRALPETDF